MGPTLESHFVMSSESLRVGFVGGGNVAERIHAPLVSLQEETELAFIADISDSCKPLARHFNSEAVIIEEPSDIPECDIAVLAIPVGVRDPYLNEFANRDIPVLVEKPFAVDIEAHKRYLAGNDSLFCNYLRACYSTTNQLAKIVNSDILGDVVEVQVLEEGKAAATGVSAGSYQTKPELSGGGVLAERGCHTLSQLAVIFDGWDATVEQASIEYTEGLDADVTALLVFNDDDREVPVKYRHSRSHPVGNRTVVKCDGGVISVNQKDATAKISLMSDSNNSSISIPPSFPSDQKTATSSLLKFEHDANWGTTFNESCYIRWREFLTSIGVLEAQEPVIRTGRMVTKLISEIYSHE